MDPRHYVSALRRLVNTSRLITGPTHQQALEACADLLDQGLPLDWMAAMLDGWVAGVTTKRQWATVLVDGTPRKRLVDVPAPFHSVLTAPGYVRFLEPRMLPVIDLRGNGLPVYAKRCQLCGLTPPGRGQSWCAACWKAFEPHTAQGWPALRRAVYERDGGICQCGCGVHVFADLHGRALSIACSHPLLDGGWECDHLTPLCEGGAHEMDNLRLLREECHRRVTGEAARRRARERRETGQPGLFGDSAP